MSLLELKDITKNYKSAKTSLWEKPTQIRAVHHVSLAIERGTCTGLVGRSGSGKSTLARLIMGMEKADYGQIIFKGENLPHLKDKTLKKMRRYFQMVFQDPFGSLNPKMTIGKSIAEPIDNYEKISSTEKEDKVKILLEEVGLKESDTYKYPSQFSGGLLQRVNIARAIALKPELLILDEVVSSLDTIAQVQVLDLLMDLQEKFNLAYLFISHDLQAANYISNQFAVMDQGEIVEEVTDPNNAKAMNHSVSRELLAVIQKEVKINVN